MSLRPVLLCVGIIFVALVALVLLNGRRGLREQTISVQAMATALGKPKTLGAPAACLYLVKEQQNTMGCDNVLLPLLHYAPGFPGSVVKPRSLTFGFRQPVTVHLRYEGAKGSGKLDAVMQREEGKWKVFSVIPVQ